jgi:hypothetical protein
VRSEDEDQANRVAASLAGKLSEAGYEPVKGGI